MDSEGGAGGIGGERSAELRAPPLNGDTFNTVLVAVGMIDLRLNALRLTWDGSMRAHHELNCYLTFERLTLPNE